LPFVFSESCPEVLVAYIERHETANPAPRRIEDRPADCTAAVIAGSAGFEIAVTRLAGKARRNRNHPAADYRRAASARRGACHRPAEAMPRAGL